MDFSLVSIGEKLMSNAKSYDFKLMCVNYK